MKKTSILLLSAIILFPGCEIVSDLFEQLQEESGCKLIKTELDIPNDPARSVTDYTYNSDNQLTEVKESEYDLDPDPYITRYTLSYTDKKLTEIKSYYTFQSNPEELNHTYSLYYSGDQLDSAFVQNHGSYGNTQGFYLTQFAGDKLSKVVYHNIDQSTGAINEHNSFTLTWTGNNVTQVVSQYPGSTPTTYLYTYDDKKAPLNSIGLGIIQAREFCILSENNVTKRTVTFSGSNTDVTDYELTYTNEGYLASKRDIRTWDTWPTNYEYDCN